MDCCESLPCSSPFGNQQRGSSEKIWVSPLLAHLVSSPFGSVALAVSVFIRWWEQSEESFRTHRPTSDGQHANMVLQKYSPNLCRQPEALSDDNFRETAALVGLGLIFFSVRKLDGPVKNTLFTWKSYHILQSFCCDLLE